mmetsp:Transcript_147984/g.368806  ORF Transcript_147984/g.368806 Transcript_147984/m.368806 type:complete len:315 (+) Transcript_147984:344-1288(+)
MAEPGREQARPSARSSHGLRGGSGKISRNARCEDLNSGMPPTSECGAIEKPLRSQMWEPTFGFSCGAWLPVGLLDTSCSSLPSLERGPLFSVGEAFLMTGVYFPGSFSYALVALTCAPMFGVLNAACTAGKLATTTTLATGHIVAFANAGAKLLQRQKPSAAEREKVLMSMVILTSLLAGAVAGSVVYCFSGDHGAHGALLPVGPLLALLFWLHDHLAKPQKLMKRVRKKMSVAGKNSMTSSGSTSQQSDDSDDEVSTEGSINGAGVEPSATINSELEAVEPGFDVEQGIGSKPDVENDAAQRAAATPAATGAP